jgi:hypothetical protein
MTDDERMQRKSSQRFFKVGCCVDDRAVSEDRRGIVPLRLAPIEHGQVPKYVFAAAAAWLRGKSVLQLSRDKMVVIPILYNSRV